MRNVTQQKFLRIHQGFEPLGHVVETAHEGVELIAFEKSMPPLSFAHARAQVALGQLASSFAQANNGAGEDEHEDECGEAADCNGHRQLRRCEVIQIFIPRVLFLVDWNDGDEDVILPACRDSRRAPYRFIADLAALNGVGESRQSREAGRIFATENLSIGIRESKVFVTLLCIGAESCAAAGFPFIGTFDSICSQVVESRVQKEIRTREAVREDKGCGDDEDEALRNPEDDEDLEEKAPHCCQSSWAPKSRSKAS